MIRKFFFIVCFKYRSNKCKFKVIRNNASKERLVNWLAVELYTLKLS